MRKVCENLMSPNVASQCNCLTETKFGTIATDERCVFLSSHIMIIDLKYTFDGDAGAKHIVTFFNTEKGVYEIHTRGCGFPSASSRME